MTNTGKAAAKLLLELVLSEIATLTDEECERLLHAIEDGEPFIRNT